MNPCDHQQYPYSCYNWDQQFDLNSQDAHPHTPASTSQQTMVIEPIKSNSSSLTVKSSEEAIPAAANSPQQEIKPPSEDKNADHPKRKTKTKSGAHPLPDSQDSDTTPASAIAKERRLILQKKIDKKRRESEKVLVESLQDLLTLKNNANQRRITKAQLFEKTAEKLVQLQFEVLVLSKFIAGFEEETPGVANSPQHEITPPKEDENSGPPQKKVKTGNLA